MCSSIIVDVVINIECASMHIELNHVIYAISSMEWLISSSIVCALCVLVVVNESVCAIEFGSLNDSSTSNTAVEQSLAASCSSSMHTYRHLTLANISV
jgi:hypothetical protein